MDHNKLFEFTAAVRGYHYYQRFRKPQPNQKLSCAYEENNPFDLFVVKTCEDTNIVGHLPIEISRALKYLMDRGVAFTVQLTSTNYRRSPLIQGGLEIPAKVIVTMSGTVHSHLLLEKYKEIINDRYVEPKNEIIIGSFLALPAVNLPKEKCKAEKDKAASKSKKKKIPKKQGQDIRAFFKSAEMNGDNDDDGEIDIRISRKNASNEPIIID